MSMRHESIEVRVNQRILWFGSEAYPLQGITRTNTLRLVPNRSAAIRHHVRTVLLALLGVVIVAAVTPTAIAVLVGVGVLTVLAYRTVKLVEFLKVELYELVIETAAGSRRGLVSDDGAAVLDLAHRITDAINNPQADFQMLVDNIHVGDNVSTYGDYSVGKALR